MFHSVRTCARSMPVAMLLLVIHDGIAAEPVEPTFERHIRPVLREYCFDCHGANGGKAKGTLICGLFVSWRQVAIRVRQSTWSSRMKACCFSAWSVAICLPAKLTCRRRRSTLLERWLAAGAKTERPEPEQIGPGIPITLEDREYWAFRPIERPEIPTFAPETRVRTPVDALLLQAMPAGLSFSPDADRADADSPCVFRFDRIAADDR